MFRCLYCTLSIYLYLYILSRLNYSQINVVVCCNTGLLLPFYIFKYVFGGIIWPMFIACILYCNNVHVSKCMRYFIRINVSFIIINTGNLN